LEGCPNRGAWVHAGNAGGARSPESLAAQLLSQR
jgi:hypothetical protein